MSNSMADHAPQAQMSHQSEIVRYTLRLPASLLSALVALAKHERRSLHGEMLQILERAVEDAGRDEKPTGDR